MIKTNLTQKKNLYRKTLYIHLLPLNQASHDSGANRSDHLSILNNPVFICRLATVSRLINFYRNRPECLIDSILPNAVHNGNKSA